MAVGVIHQSIPTNGALEGSYLAGTFQHSCFQMKIPHLAGATPAPGQFRGELMVWRPGGA